MGGKSPSLLHQEPSAELLDLVGVKMDDWFLGDIHHC